MSKIKFLAHSLKKINFTLRGKFSGPTKKLSKKKLKKKNEAWTLFDVYIFILLSYITRKQCLIDRDRRRHATNKGTDSHQYVIFLIK